VEVIFCSLFDQKIVLGLPRRIRVTPFFPYVSTVSATKPKDMKRLLMEIGLVFLLIITSVFIRFLWGGVCVCVCGVEGRGREVVGWGRDRQMRNNKNCGPEDGLSARVSSLKSESTLYILYLRNYRSRSSSNRTLDTLTDTTTPFPPLSPSSIFLVSPFELNEWLVTEGTTRAMIRQRDAN